MAGNSPRIHALTRDSRRRAVVALGLVAVAWRSPACSGKDSTKDANGNGTPDAQATAQGLTVAGEWPLTGLHGHGRGARTTR